MTRSLPVGQLARRAGTTAKAVRYSEGLGLLDPASRVDNSYRVYDSQRPAANRWSGARRQSPW